MEKHNNFVPFKKYNIIGKYIDVKFNESFCTEVYKGQWLPAVVLGEYPKFLQVEILPHINKCEFAQGESKPYIKSLNKLAIAFGEIEIRPMRYEWDDDYYNTSYATYDKLLNEKSAS